MRSEQLLKDRMINDLTKQLNNVITENLLKFREPGAIAESFNLNNKIMKRY